MKFRSQLNRSPHRRRWLGLISLVALLIALLCGWGWRTQQPFAPALTPAAQQPVPASLHYRVMPHPHAIIHILTIPHDSRYGVRPHVVPTLQTVEQVAQESGAIAVLNGGYFDPSNQKSTAFVTRDGVPVADPRANENLITNKNLIPDLDKILNRSEFRRYQCGSIGRYAIAVHREPPPTGCQLVDSLGGGPRLLPNLTATAESFWGLRPEGTRDPIGLNQPNARSAIGITRDGDLLWVLVAQASPTQPGLSLPELAKLMADLGSIEAMNLDGGSSASWFYAGHAVYGRLDDSGQRVKRAVKSMLVLTPLPVTPP